MEVKFADAQDNRHRLTPMNHRIGRWLFGLGVGFLVALLAFRWITNPAPRVERQLEESVVTVARQHLEATLRHEGVLIVDPLAPNRTVGKSYVYREGEGWEVSGFYRRGEGDRWHPFLMGLDSSLAMASLKVQDAGLVDRAKTEPLLEAVP